MMFIWKGEEGGDASCVLFGLEFHVGVPVDVSGALSPREIEKLRGNPFFEEVAAEAAEPPMKRTRRKAEPDPTDVLEEPDANDEN